MSFASNSSPSSRQRPALPPYVKHRPLAIPKQQSVPSPCAQQVYTPTIVVPASPVGSTLSIISSEPPASPVGPMLSITSLFPSSLECKSRAASCFTGAGSGPHPHRAIAARTARRLGNEAKRTPLRHDRVPEGKASPKIAAEPRIVRNQLSHGNQPHGFVEARLAHDLRCQAGTIFLVVSGEAAT